MRRSTDCSLVFSSYEPSKADIDTFSKIQAPQAKTPNVLRWYNHIKSFSDKERSEFSNKSAEFSTVAAKPSDDDDDVDLFGSDDEEVIHFIYYVTLKRLNAVCPIECSILNFIIIQGLFYFLNCITIML